MNNRYICKAKRKDNNEWIEGYLYITHDGEYEISKYDEMTGIERFTCVVIPETVRRCTELKDKNGKWIFEGDIVKLTDINNGIEWRAYVVFGNPYGEYNWGWNLMYTGENPKVDTDILLWVEVEETGAYCEVIGNIHDDDLLEVER